jgi:hypothetical protein
MGIVSMKKTVTIITILLILVASLPLLINAEKIKIGNYEVETCGIDQELNLLKGDFYLYLDAIENVSTFNIRYAFPPEYGYQYPIYLEILDDSTANITDYKIEDEANIPNKVINFTIGELKTNKQVLIHFNCWVLSKSYNFEDLPEFVEIPSINDIPNETKKWLEPTEVVQSENILIKLRAWQMKLFTENNLLKLAEKTAKFCKNHRYLLYLIQFNLQKILQFPPQDALTTLLVNGECPGRSHLGCALFRANGIPARVILAMPHRYDFWYEMHYMMEYYSHDFNWILTEVHHADTPFPPQNQIILRICYPEDENNTQADFMYPRMKCLERWLWIDNESIKPYYVDCKEGSKIKSFNENSVVVDLNVANDSIDLTTEVFNKFQNYLKINLEGNNLNHFENASDYIKQAINELDNSIDSFGYIYYLDKANDEFNLITI